MGLVGAVWNVFNNIGKHAWRHWLRQQWKTPSKNNLNTAFGCHYPNNFMSSDFLLPCQFPCLIDSFCVRGKLVNLKLKMLLDRSWEKAAYQFVNVPSASDVEQSWTSPLPLSPVPESEDRIQKCVFLGLYHLRGESHMTLYITLPKSSTAVVCLPDVPITRSWSKAVPQSNYTWSAKSRLLWWSKNVVWNWGLKLQLFLDSMFWHRCDGGVRMWFQTVV